MTSTENFPYVTVREEIKDYSLMTLWHLKCHIAVVPLTVTYPYFVPCGLFFFASFRTFSAVPHQVPERMFEMIQKNRKK